MNTKALFVIGLLAMSCSAVHAQQSNQQYFEEQQRNQQQQHAAEQARQGYMASQEQQGMQQQQPTGEWKTTWGAIATDNVKGVLGSVVGRASKGEASNAALADCQSKGGAECKVDLAYFNQCAAMVVGAKEYRLYGAATVEEATQRGLKTCNATDSNCRVYYTECSKPQFVRY